MKPTQYDYSAFAKQYSSREVYRYFMSGSYAIVKIIGLVVVFIVLGIFGLSTLFILTAVVRSVVPGSTGTVTIGLGWVLSAVLIMLAMWFIIKSTARVVAQTMRLRDFALANNMGFQLTAPPNNQPGTMFQYGSSRYFDQVITLPGTSKAMIGNYRYTTGSGKNRQVHTYGVVRVSLSRKLPHVMLDATSNNFLGRISNFGGFDSEQRIELEGDFNKFFSVYAPTNYGRDTLYWLTPELMDLLKTHFTAYDIEVIDNYAYLYSNRTFGLDETSVKNLLGLAEWLHDEFEENTRRYSDERVGSFATNTIAQPGRRLKRQIPWWFIVGAVIWIIIQLLSNFR